MSTTRLPVVNTAGISEKIGSARFDDPKFAIFEGGSVSGKPVTSDAVVTAAGISAGQTGKSKEGIGTGGFDRHFNVFGG